MSDGIGKPEKVTQKRVIQLFRDELDYEYLGDWTERPDNSNIEKAALSKWLIKQGHSEEAIGRALHKLGTAAALAGRDLYHTNQAVYDLLRHGVPVKVEAGEVTASVQLIDWKNPEQNDFQIAEEVTLIGEQKRRPDLVLYVNGIAVGVIELKSSVVSIGDGIRQLISNQRPEFNSWFFTTVQLVFAGSDSEGLRYGTTETEEKYFLKWKEDEEDNAGYKLDKYLVKMCAKSRLIEIMRDFVLFDGGIKKVPRVHQYFGIKEAQKYALRRESGIIWHAQGSGKSIVMVLLAKWILENLPHARVAVITDRDGLDKQIERVFTESGEDIYRTRSGRDLMAKLGKVKPRLLCSLVHKFGRRDVKDFEKFIAELESQPSAVQGQVFVFVDECHRTQSGKLNRAMKAVMPQAVFMGFTGTPLLRKDRETTMEVFGHYIHTYKFKEAVEDEVVLDLIYEARDIDQELGSEEKIDAWFDAKTKGLNDWQRVELKRKWGTMQKVLSSKSRMGRVVSDIVFDFSVKPRLSGERGNAILVARSIFEACCYMDLFLETPLKNKCAIVTSYDPNAGDVSKEDTGADSETDKEVIYKLYQKVLADVDPLRSKSKTETYEDAAKLRFIKEPAQMRLLIVVDKLLTGFDAPPCTYLYIDKTMRDHGLFQAICRTNRLDGDDKDFGYIVDYKNLFENLINEKGTGALQVYTEELDESAGGEDPQILMQNRLKRGKERLDEALEVVALLKQEIEPPANELECIHYFCGNSEVASDLESRAPQRSLLYKAVVVLVRAFANLADDMSAAGYSETDVIQIKARVDEAVKLRDTIRKASGEYLDLKQYEADMRHLIDKYIDAKEPRKISPFEDFSLLEIIEKSGIDAAIAERLGGMGGNQEAVAETIENNVRRKIIQEHLNNPAYFETMSELLDEIIKDRKEMALDYEKYLKEIAALIKKVSAGFADNIATALKRSPALRALYDNLGEVDLDNLNLVDQVAEEGPEDPRLWLASKIDAVVRKVKPFGFKGVQSKENIIKAALMPWLGEDEDRVNQLFEIIKQQGEY